MTEMCEWDVDCVLGVHDGPCRRPSFMNDELDWEIRRMHRRFQWRGWRKAVQVAAQNRLAYYDAWCVECRKPWPCPTIQLLDVPPMADSKETA